MRTFLWVVLFLDQLLLLIVSSVNLQKFELSDFAFRRQLEHHSGEDAKQRRALHQRLAYVKLLQAAEAICLLLIGGVLWTHLNQPFIGLVYALAFLMIIALLRRLSVIENTAEAVFFRLLNIILKVSVFIQPLGLIVGVPSKRELLLPGTLEEFRDLLRRLPSTVLQPAQRQRLETLLASDEKKVKDIMTPKRRLVMIEPSATLGPVVLNDLEKSGHGYFPVATKKGEPEGILTLSDVADIHLAKQRSSVRELMSLHIAWIEESAPLLQLAEVILNQKQYIVLARNEEGEFSGVVTMADLMKHLVGIVKD